MKTQKRILAVFVAVLMLSAMMGTGCSSRRGTTINPLPDPIYRDTGTGPGIRPIGGGTSTTDIGPWTVSRLQNRWQYIIVHHSATSEGGARRFDQAHRNNGWDEMGYHFVIGNGSDTRDGQIEVGHRWAIQKHGAHCRVAGDPTNKYNEHGIGICLVGDFSHRQPSRKQMEALTYLTKGLMEYTHLRPSDVHYHEDFDNTECPGRHFPYREFEKAIRR